MRILNHFYRYHNVLSKRSTKFGIKAGLVGGAAYYIADQGVWRDSETTREVYDRIRTASSPYTQQITRQIPYELPSLPRTGEIAYLANYYWNTGVKNTFNFIANIPSYIKEYSSKGYNALLDNSEVKNMLSSDVKN